MTWAAAKAEIRRIERELKLDLARAQRGAERWLLQERSTLWRAVWLEQLRARMRRAILASGWRAYRAGYRVADRVVERRRSAARFRGPDEPPRIPEAWVTWYEGTVDQALGRYTDRVRRDVAGLTQRGAIEGWTVDELTREVRGLVDGMVTWQAERIARTETMRLWNVGSYSRMEQEDEDLIGYEYSVVLDDRTSHVCRPLRGKRVRRGELKYVPPLHPHCRTNLEPLFSFDAGADGVEWASPDDATGVPGFGQVPRPPEGLGAVPRIRPEKAAAPTPTREPKAEPKLPQLSDAEHLPLGSEQRLQAETEVLAAHVRRAVGRQGKWNGTVRRRRLPGAVGMKGWDCHIAIAERYASQDRRYGTMVHELGHSLSEGLTSYDYSAKGQAREEGVVEGMTRAILDDVMKAAGRPIVLERRAYQEEYDALEWFRAYTGMERREYYLGLLATPLRDRADTIKEWVRGRWPARDESVVRAMGRRLGLGRVPAK